MDIGNGITLTAFGQIRMINFLNVSIPNGTASKSFALPDWFCKNVVGIYATTGSDYSGLTSEVYFRSQTKALEIQDGKNTAPNRSYSGQIVAFATD